MNDLLSAVAIDYRRALIDHCCPGSAACQGSGRDISDPLDLIGCDSFKDYLYWCSSRGSLSIYTLPRVNTNARARDTLYWRVNEVTRTAFRLPGLSQFCSQRNHEVSTVLTDWIYWLRKPESFGVFCEYDAFMSMWSEKHSPSTVRPGRLFLEVIFGYVYSRIGTAVGELSPLAVAYNS